MAANRRHRRTGPRKQIGNDNLRAALQHAGLQPDDLAQIVEVDTKTVRRWLSGRPPYPRHRGKIARALDTTQHQLWPELATHPPSRPADAATDLLAAHPTTGEPAAPDWHALMEQTVERIELLDETLLHVLETEGVPDILAAKAAEGCEIRILIAEDYSSSVSANEGTFRRTDPEPEDDEQSDHKHREWEAKMWAWRDDNQRSRELLQPLIGLHGIDVHAYVSDRVNTILRFDEQMLVTLHLWTRSTLEAPLLHLQRNAPGGLFDRFAEHYDALWRDTSLPIEPADEPESDDEAQTRDSCGDTKPPGGHEPAAASPHPPTGPPADSTPDPARPRRWPRQPPPETTAH